MAEKIGSVWAIDIGNTSLKALRLSNEFGTLEVIGFDNITLADRITPPLTTMDVDKVSLGRLAVELLLYRLRFHEAAVTQTSHFTILYRTDVGTPTLIFFDRTVDSLLYSRLCHNGHVFSRSNF